MIENNVYFSDSFYFSWDKISGRKEPLKVLLASPEYFQVIDIKNPYMAHHNGKTDKHKAYEQWNGLLQHYFNLKAKGIIEDVKIIPGAEGCEDMVFAANQSFPWINEEEEKMVIMSRMKHASRQKEVPYFEKFYIDQEYKILPTPGNTVLEGMGDLIPIPGKNLIMAGYGHRTEKDSLIEISKILNVPIIGLELISDQFYHLDTCFIPIDHHTILYCADAFNTSGLQILNKIFKNHIRIPKEEAIQYFSLNAHYIASGLRKVAILEKGSVFTYSAFRNLGIEIIETDTSEFIKSGGSVFCMKMMYY